MPVASCFSAVVIAAARLALTTARLRLVGHSTSGSAAARGSTAALAVASSTASWKRRKASQKASPAAASTASPSSRSTMARSTTKRTNASRSGTRQLASLPAPSGSPSRIAMARPSAAYSSGISSAILSPPYACRRIRACAAMPTTTLSSPSIQSKPSSSRAARDDSMLSDAHATCLTASRSWPTTTIFLPARSIEKHGPTEQHCFVRNAAGSPLYESACPMSGRQPVADGG
eukprot:scaffold112302_cov67-Phaeocystis_antarctica.AAC.9